VRFGHPLLRDRYVRERPLFRAVTSWS
jgi:hypothetical protein